MNPISGNCAFGALPSPIASASAVDNRSMLEAGFVAESSIVLSKSALFGPSALEPRPDVPPDGNEAVEESPE